MIPRELYVLCENMRDFEKQIYKIDGIDNDNLGV